MKNYLPPLILFAAALALRLLYLWEIADSPFFTSPVVDAYTYAQQARLIAQGHWLDYTPDPFWQPPLYPWFLGAVCKLSGESFLLVARLLQALAGACACLLVYRLGQRLFSRQTGLLAGALLAGYGPAICFDGELLPASLALLLFPALLLAVLWADERQGTRRWLWPGLLLGVAALNVATFLVLAPLILAWSWARSREQAPRLRLQRLGLFLGGCLLVIAPVTLRNWSVKPELVLISWNGGVNFFLGNNPDFPHTVQIRPGEAWLELMERPTQAGFAPGAQSSAYFLGAAWDFIRSHPLDWAWLLAQKAADFWKGDEVGRNQNLYYLRDYSHLLGVLMWKGGIAFPFGLIAPLALLGLALARRERGPAGLLLWSLLVYAAGVIVFFVTDRYRLPVIPGLLLLAALALQWLVAQGRQRRWQSGWLAGLPLLALWCNQGIGSMGMEVDAEAHYNLGQAFIEQQKLGEGIAALERAAALAPDEADILFSLGTAYGWAGDLGRGVEVLARAAQLYPGRLDIRLNLGNFYFQRQLYAQAAEEYRPVLTAHPDHVETLRSAARATARAGQRDHATTYYEQLRRLDPNAIEPCLALGYFYRQAGQREQALHLYQQALVLDPDHLTALLESGALLLERGELQKALSAFRRARDLGARTPLDSLEGSQR
jgi:tetratricopeptide (TPR) repeat protein